MSERRITLNYVAFHSMLQQIKLNPDKPEVVSRFVGHAMKMLDKQLAAEVKDPTFESICYKKHCPDQIIEPPKP